MSSRRSVRQLLVAVILGVLVGGGLMAVTPAGAEVSNAVATNWKKIWKKNLKPLADKRYYTKAQSDTKYATKAESAASAAAAQAGATSAANAATDTKLADYYKKAETDAKYQTKTQLIRGGYMTGGTAAAAGAFLQDAISYGVTLSAAPTVHFIAMGGPLPVGCSGTAAAPDALPGHLCVFEAANLNHGAVTIFQVNGSGGSSTMGAILIGSSSAAGQSFSAGSWAVRPVALAGARVAPAPTGSGTFGR